MRPVTAGAIGAVAALAVVLAGCAAADPPIVVTHVHAVDLDDERGVVYVATHDGILAVTADEPGAEDAGASPAGYGSVERLGDWAGDVMGMARLDETIYLSGHPAAGANTAPNIGVYQANVLDQEFIPLSLEGEVDFHNMTVGGASAANAVLAGIDSVSGRIFVSRDGGQAWAVGAALGARSLSWDAAAERLYATTEQGLQVSSDDGATFTVVDGAPILVLIASSPSDASSDAFWAGVDVDRVVHTSVDGVSWSATGNAPAGTEAIAVSRGGSLVAGGVESVWRSDDQGMTWTVIVEF